MRRCHSLLVELVTFRKLIKTQLLLDDTLSLGNIMWHSLPQRRHQLV